MSVSHEIDEYEPMNKQPNQPEPRNLDTRGHHVTVEEDGQEREYTFIEFVGETDEASIISDEVRTLEHMV